MSGFYHGPSSSLGIDSGAGGGIVFPNHALSSQSTAATANSVTTTTAATTTTMTIEEMRHLHRTALAEAEMKRTELRLVLASRYRELVGSSDEVLHMRERAEELQALILNLPKLVNDVSGAAQALENDNYNKDGITDEENNKGNVLVTDLTVGGDENLNYFDPLAIRSELSRLPRHIHQCLDNKDVHGAASSLIALFDIIVACSGMVSNGNSPSSSPYPLAFSLSSFSKARSTEGMPREWSGVSKIDHETPLLEMQIRMIYLHVQTLPSRTVRLARKVLLQSAAEAVRISDGKDNAVGQNRGREQSNNGRELRKRVSGGAHSIAAALSALDLLESGHGEHGMPDTERATKLIDLYYESKATLLEKLLNKLATPSTEISSPITASSSLDAAGVTQRAEIILSKIVMILQYDVILYPYQIFVKRKFRIHSSEIDDKYGTTKSECSDGKETNRMNFIMSTLPHFDPDLLKSKASRFLEAHLPLIRTKVKSVLMIIAGTTASRLGHIRQTLYDKTDGAECIAALDNCGVCTWDEAVGGMVDTRLINYGTTGLATTASSTSVDPVDKQRSTFRTSSTASANVTIATTQRSRFSLWGTLFSNIFSSLVHSLLTTSFHSVHARVVSTLRTSLARAPPFEFMLPHEARRNALRIASDLDASLRKVSDDAHELLVHAEERDESERRLRQSLYVQTCEIMGRLLNELRRMLVSGDNSLDEDITKAFIVGRLCHLLKFRLKSLPTLLDPKNSPAVTMGGRGSGMITLVELRSSFDLADDDDDGLISFDEAMEAMESAFSGTHSHGAEMVRDTLLLTHPTGLGEEVTNTANSTYAHDNSRSTPETVTLSELVLLSARGLKHDASGPESALGTVQSSLDKIIGQCFKKWARAALLPSLNSFVKTLRENIAVASTVSDIEWRRLHSLTDQDDDAMLKLIQKVKGDETQFNLCNTATVGEVSPFVVSYLLAVSGVLNRSICPADSLPPVPSLDFANALGISISHDAGCGIPNMMIIIRESLIGEALSSITESLQQEMNDDNTNQFLMKCSLSSLVQLEMDINFIHHCFFLRQRHDISQQLNDYSTDNDEKSRSILENVSKCISSRVVNALGEDRPQAVTEAMSESHMRVLSSCDLFLTPLFGEDSARRNFTSLTASPSSSVSFSLNPITSSRRFILLPIQADKTQSELLLRGKYGKRLQEEKTQSSNGGKDSSSSASSNPLGTGFGFLSSMLSTKNRS